MGASNATVLIQGESGTGKEELARAIHVCGKRMAEPFVPVDLASISPEMIGSELFGHAKGAFTSATSARKGLIRSAEKGTVFLDEIGELPLNLQTTLLRVIQERRVRPVGSEEVFAIEARLIAATNRRLPEAVRQGLFREDLYHRLNVVEIVLPPLRERKADIPELAQHFLAKYSAERPSVRGFTAEAIALLTRHDWPGNVRELENAILRAIVVGAEDEIEASDLPLQIAKFENAGLPPGNVEPIIDSRCTSGMIAKASAPATLAANEQAAIVAALSESHGHRQRAAEILGIGVATLYRKLKRYQIP
jgi:DNA-binding NtrC family response regulator